MNPPAVGHSQLAEPGAAGLGTLPFRSSSPGERCGRLLISIEEPELADALCAHFERSGFHAEPVDGGMIDVRLGSREGHGRAVGGKLLVTDADERT